jgi:diketogulonate reductase-like aldo/keto reductase
MFIITKFWIHEAADIEKALRQSLERLQLDYVDMYMIHWPINVTNEQKPDGSFGMEYKRLNIPIYKQWAEMERIVELKLTKSIGVSNFNVQSLNDLLTYVKILPVANEVELHPLCT